MSSPRPPLPPPMNRAVAALHAPEPDESSADETTAVMRGQGSGTRGTIEPGGGAAAPQTGGDAQAARRRRSRSATQGREGGARQQDGDGGQSWWRRVAEEYGSVELENKGSVARDHLALERTFLAWLRTSLSFASIGVAITQLFRLNTSLNPSSSPSASANPQATLHHVGKPLGATFIGIAIAVLLVGYHRYFESQHWIIRGKFPASRGAVVFVALVAGALMLASLVVVVSVARGDE